MSRSTKTLLVCILLLTVMFIQLPLIKADETVNAVMGVLSIETGKPEGSVGDLVIVFGTVTPELPVNASYVVFNATTIPGYYRIAGGDIDAFFVTSGGRLFYNSSDGEWSISGVELPHMQHDYYNVTVALGTLYPNGSFVELERVYIVDPAKLFLVKPMIVEDYVATTWNISGEALSENTEELLYGVPGLVRIRIGGWGFRAEEVKFTLIGPDGLEVYLASSIPNESGDIYFDVLLPPDLPRLPEGYAIAIVGPTEGNEALSNKTLIVPYPELVSFKPSEGYPGKTIVNVVAKYFAPEVLKLKLVGEFSTYSIDVEVNGTSYVNTTFTLPHNITRGYYDLNISGTLPDNMLFEEDIIEILPLVTSFTPSQGYVGDKPVIVGYGFKPLEEVEVIFFNETYGKYVIGTVTADSSGVINGSGTMEIPEIPGCTYVVKLGYDSGSTLTEFTFEVLPQIASVTPESGVAGSLQDITIVFNGLLPGDSVRVSFVFNDTPSYVLGCLASAIADETGVAVAVLSSVPAKAGGVYYVKGTVNELYEVEYFKGFERVYFTIEANITSVEPVFAVPGTIVSLTAVGLYPNQMNYHVWLIGEQRIHEVPYVSKPPIGADGNLTLEFIVPNIPWGDYVVAISLDKYNETPYGYAEYADYLTVIPITTSLVDLVTFTNDTFPGDPVNITVVGLSSEAGMVLFVADGTTVTAEILWQEYYPDNATLKLTIMTPNVVSGNYSVAIVENETDLVYIAGGLRVLMPIVAYESATTVLPGDLINLTIVGAVPSIESVEFWCNGTLAASTSLLSEVHYGPSGGYLNASLRIPAIPAGVYQLVLVERDLGEVGYLWMSVEGNIWNLTVREAFVEYVSRTELYPGYTVMLGIKGVASNIIEAKVVSPSGDEYFVEVGNVVFYSKGVNMYANVTLIIPSVSEDIYCFELVFEGVGEVAPLLFENGSTVYVHVYTPWVLTPSPVGSTTPESTLSIQIFGVNDTITSILLVDPDTGELIPVDITGQVKGVMSSGDVYVNASFIAPVVAKKDYTVIIVEEKFGEIGPIRSSKGGSPWIFTLIPKMRVAVYVYRGGMWILTDTISVGDLVKVEGVGFGPRTELVDVVLKRVSPMPIVMESSQDISMNVYANGEAEVLFTVPSLPAGTYYISVFVEDPMNLTIPVPVKIVPRIEAEPLAVQVGSMLTVKGYGFLENEDVLIMFYDRVIAETTANDNGEFTVSFRVPSAVYEDGFIWNIVLGYYTISAYQDALDAYGISQAESMEVFIYPYDYEGLSIELEGGLLYYGNNTSAYHLTIITKFNGEPVDVDVSAFNILLKVVGSEGSVFTSYLDSSEFPVVPLIANDTVVKGVYEVWIDLTSDNFQSTVVGGPGTYTLIVMFDGPVYVTPSTIVDQKAVRALTFTINPVVNTIIEDLSQIKNETFRIEDVILQLRSLNATIIELINGPDGVKAKIDTALGIVEVDLDELNATIVRIGNSNKVEILTEIGSIEGIITEIKNNVATIQTDVGTITVKVDQIIEGQGGLATYIGMIAVLVILGLALTVYLVFTLRK